jgi:hypothetical protein
MVIVFLKREVSQSSKGEEDLAGDPEGERTTSKNALERCQQLS